MENFLRRWVNSQWKSTVTGRHVGGGLGSGGYALGLFLQQDIMGDALFAMTRENGKLVQLDQTGKAALAISDEVAAQDDTMWYRFFTRTAFK